MGADKDVYFFIRTRYYLPRGSLGKYLVRFGIITLMQGGFWNLRVGERK